MSEKKILIQFTDGSIWGISARIIAHHRAEHYKEDGYKADDYKAEFDFAMSHDYELTDWMSGNMDFSDVEPHMERIGTIEADYKSEWDNAEKWIGEQS